MNLRFFKKKFPKLYLFFKNTFIPTFLHIYSCVGIEIVESKELFSLLIKSFSKPLNTEETKKVKDQFFDILKAIPLLFIFLIPGGAFILAILIKVLPKKMIYPSAFLQKKL